MKMLSVFQGEHQKISVCQRFQHDHIVLVHRENVANTLLRDLLDLAKGVEQDALIGEMKPVGVVLKQAFDLYSLSVMGYESNANGALGFA